MRKAQLSACHSLKVTSVLMTVIAEFGFFGDLAQVLRIGKVKVINILVFTVCSLNTIDLNVALCSFSLMSRKAFI